MEIGPNNCKHVFIDIVGYSKDRTVEAQIEIITKLNEIVINRLLHSKLSPRNYLMLPTGDGICLSIINHPQYDIAITFSVQLLEEISQYNKSINDQMRRFEIRIGINENIDNIITDINKRKNVAGSGINYAQRIMAVADGSMIMIGPSVYEQVNRRDKYYGKFKKWYASIKHGEQLSVYQYVENNIEILNIDSPSIFQVQAEKKREINISEYLSIFLVLIYKGLAIYGPLIKDGTDSEYAFVMLYYLSDYINDHYNNSKTVVKGFSGNYLDAISDDGRNISLTNAMKEIKKKIDSGLMLSHLVDYLYNKLIIENNAQSLFENPYKALQLSDKGKEIVETKCFEQLQFIKEIH